MIDYNRITVNEAIILQSQLRERTKIKPFNDEISTIAGADISFNRFSPKVYAGIVVMTYPEMKVLQTSLVVTETRFPYVTGFFPFREMPALQQAWDQLTVKPDMLVLDGHGITHPRKMGIATQFGIANNQPTIGCGSTSLHGKFENPDIRRFSFSEITGNDEELLGYALRTKNAIKPIFVSPGHLTDPDTALDIIRNCCGPYRIPEPTRIAHQKLDLLRNGALPAGVYYETA